MKVVMTVEVDLVPGMHLKDEEERIWAENEVFIGDGTLVLHSNEVGDEIGVVKKVKKIRWVD